MTNSPMFPGSVPGVDVGGGPTDRPPPFSCALLHSVLNLATATKPTVLRIGRAQPSANTRPATEAKLGRPRSKGGRLDYRLRQQHGRARRLARLEIAVRLRGVLQRIFLID